MSSEITSYESFQDTYIKPQKANEAVDDQQPEAKMDFSLFNEQLSAATPKSCWWEIQGTTVRKEFKDEYYLALEKSALGEGLSVDEITQDIIKNKGYGQIYAARAESAEGLSKTAAEVRFNHQPENIAKTKQRLTYLMENLDSLLATAPDFIKQEFRARLAKELRYCEEAQHIGDEGFTANYLSENGWNNLLDLSSLEAEELKLKYEDDALAVLEINRARESKPDRYASISDALATWNLTQAELSSLNLSAKELQGNQFPAERIQQFFQLLKAREPKLREWQFVIDESAMAVTVNGEVRTVSIPQKRVFTPADLVAIPAHEFVHIIGSENGYEQPIATMIEGMEDYGPTEEGKAVFSELITGQEFGDKRQVKMAARYYAISMAVKTEQTEEGSYKAKHSMQEIFNTLIEMKVDLADAKDIVWRIMRGTSLQRKAVSVTAGGKSIMVGEVYSKDAIYFEGQMLMFDRLLSGLPLSTEDRADLTRWETRDVSNRLLARVGRRAFLGENPDISKDIADTAENRMIMRRETYNKLLKKGKEVLYQLLQYALVGTINWDVLEKRRDEWNEILNRDPSKLANYALVMRGPTPLATV